MADGFGLHDDDDDDTIVSPLLGVVDASSVQPVVEQSPDGFDPFPVHVAAGPDGLRQRRTQAVPALPPPPPRSPTNRSYLTRDRVPVPPQQPPAPPPPPRPWPWQRAAAHVTGKWVAAKASATAWANGKRRAWWDWMAEETNWPGRLAAAMQRHRKYIVGGGLGCCMSFAVFVVLFLVAADTSPLTAADLRASAPGGVPWAIFPGTNYTAGPSTDMTCTELREALAATAVPRALEASERVLLAGDGLQCVCAPMFGLRRRHLAVLFPATADAEPDGDNNNDTATVRHLFNVHLMAEPPAGQPPQQPFYHRVPEHQRMMFAAAGPDFVHNVRVNAVWLAYMAAPSDNGCKTGAMLLTDYAAYCAQACLDLYDGVSVYQRATLAAVL